MSGSRRGLVLALGVAACLALAFLVVWRGGDQPAAPASPVVGVVIAVDARGLTDVRSFTLRLRDGSRLTFTLDRLENGVQFPPSHLTVHQADGVPVRVTFVVDGNVLAATRLEDAPAT
jgi:hypothetical protein